MLKIINADEEYQYGESKDLGRRVVIPTYEIGEPDKNPMFLEKRVYQGQQWKGVSLSDDRKRLVRKRQIKFTRQYFLRISILR